MYQSHSLKFDVYSSLVNYFAPVKNIESCYFHTMFLYFRINWCGNIRNENKFHFIA